MAQKDRLDGIRAEVRTGKRVVVSELSKYFNVTEETIRRDLEKLEQEGLITRTHGGAVLNVDDSMMRISYVRRAQIHVKEKRIIAQIVAELIPNHSIAIGADSSSTVMQALHAFSNREDLLLMTYSANTLRELGDSEINILSTGGLLNKKTHSLQGMVTRNTIKEYNMDIVLLSCRGIHPESGVFDSDEDEAEIKRLMITKTERVILLVDHTKFGRVAFAKLFDLNHVHTVVTDQKPGDEWVAIFEENGIELLYPGKK